MSNAQVEFLKAPGGAVRFTLTDPSGVALSIWTGDAPASEALESFSNILRETLFALCGREEADALGAKMISAMEEAAVEAAKQKGDLPG